MPEIVEIALAFFINDFVVFAVFAFDGDGVLAGCRSLVDIILALKLANIGIERYFDEYFPRTSEQNRILSLGGFSADEFSSLVETVNRRAKPGDRPAFAEKSSESRYRCGGIAHEFGVIHLKHI